jgi:hypothetical protein
VGKRKQGHPDGDVRWGGGVASSGASPMRRYKKRFDLPLPPPVSSYAEGIIEAWMLNGERNDVEARFQALGAGCWSNVRSMYEQDWSGSRLKRSSARKVELLAR